MFLVYLKHDVTKWKTILVIVKRVEDDVNIYLSIPETRRMRYENIFSVPKSRRKPWKDIFSVPKTRPRRCDNIFIVAKNHGR